MPINQIDIALLESGSGGDFTINGNDVAIDYSIANDIYLRMFGGNVEADTKNPRQTNEQDFSYWGNSFITNQIQQFNSLTERTLKTTPLTSFGIVIIENAIKKDLNTLPGLNSISVKIVSINRINIVLKIILPNNENKIVSFALVINKENGDFDIEDFYYEDFLIA